MDFWASLEHKVRYKKNLTDEELQRISFELKDCARRSAALDLRMQRVKDIIIESEKSREREENSWDDDEPEMQLDDAALREVYSLEQSTEE
jgi:ppGpp synthetase/RelA/SpoT-type nucleotidyltranferase